MLNIIEEAQSCQLFRKPKKWAAMSFPWIADIKDISAFENFTKYDQKPRYSQMHCFKLLCKSVGVKYVLQMFPKPHLKMECTLPWHRHAARLSQFTTATPCSHQCMHLHRMQSTATYCNSWHFIAECATNYQRTSYPGSSGDVWKAWYLDCAPESFSISEMGLSNTFKYFQKLL